MRKKESETLEFKKSTAEVKAAVVSLVAMLNKHQKGEVYFGIDDNCRVLGLTIGRTTIKDITQSFVDNIEPKIFPKVEVVTISKRDCICVVAEGNVSPYFAYGRAYVRVGESDKAMSPQEIEKRILEKKKTLWEKEISEKTIKDVNKAVVKDFMRKAKAARRINFDFKNVKTVLSKLGLLCDNKLTKAAEILFCDENSMEIQAAIFAGIDKLTFLDIKSFKGNLFELRGQAEIYVNSNMRWRADLSESRRKEIPEIPVRALAEAIGNSLCHRDYSNPKGNEVAIFKNRIEIYNPGRFPEELDPEDFIKGEGHSILRNPLIAETMFRSEDIEKWASGIKRIYEECQKSRIDVEFKRNKTGFVIVFYRPKWEAGKDVSERQTVPEKVPERVPERVPEKILERITDNQKRIVQSIANNSNITIAKMAKIVGISERKIKTNLAKLKEKGVIRRIGSDRGGRWEVLDADGRRSNADDRGFSTTDPRPQTSDNRLGKEIL